MIKIEIKNKQIIPINADTLKRGGIYEFNSEFYIITFIGVDIYMINLQTGKPLFLVGPVYIKEVKSAILTIER